MSKKDDEKENKYEHLTEAQAEKAEKAVEKLSAVRAAKKLSNPNSKWTLSQEIMQEIMATYTIKDPDKIPASNKLRKDLIKEIELRYEDDKELKKLLLDSVPSDRSIRVWLKKPGWDEEVWKKIRDRGLFTKEKRAEMINALYQRGVLKSDNAAKIWLTLSGDYQEKMEVQNKIADTFREINQVLQKKTDND